MAKELEHFDSTGLTIYAKPVPLQTGTWGSDDISLPEDTVDGYYHADVATPADSYIIFQQAGGSPANTDTPVASVNYRQRANVDQIEGSGTIDTLSLTSLLEIAASFMSGETVVSTIAGGKRIIMYKQDGSTEKLRIDFDADGQWIATTVS